MKKLIFICVLTLSVMAQQQQNPASMWCDYHNASLIKGGVEHPNGVCYDVYTHRYYDKECKCYRTHKVTVKCPR